MPNYDIRNFRTTDFDEDIELEFQQRGSRLEGTYMEEPMVGTDATFNVLGATEATQSTVMFGDTPEPANLTNLVRVCVPTRWHDVAWIDEDEWDQSLATGGKLQPKYASNLAYGLGRRKDLIVMNAMVGDAVTRTFNTATGLHSDTVVPFDTANRRIAHGNLPMSVDKIIDVVALLSQDEAADGRIWCEITPHQKAQLMKDGQFTSFDYNSARPLVNGFLGSYYGVNFVESSLLNNALFPALNSATIDTALFWNMSAVGFKRRSSIRTTVSIRSDKQDLIQLYARATGGFTRIQDAGVYQVQTWRAA